MKSATTNPITMTSRPAISAGRYDTAVATHCESVEIARTFAAARIASA
nr:hypothetical protein [Haladaptatus litoreus]